MNPQLDVLIDRYLTTIPFDERMEAAKQITQHVTENLPALPLFFDTWPSATSPRLKKSISARYSRDSAFSTAARGVSAWRRGPSAGVISGGD